MPHAPIFTSEEFKGKSKQGLYGDAIEEIDYNTGRILDQLKKLGIEDNTIVIFTSDNGPWLGKGKKMQAVPFLFLKVNLQVLMAGYVYHVSSDGLKRYLQDQPVQN